MSREPSTELANGHEADRSGIDGPLGCNGSFVGCAFVLLLVGVLSGFFRDTWWLILLLVLCLVGWGTLGAVENRWAKATRGVLGAVALGLGITIISAFIVIAQGPPEPFGTIWALQETLARTRLALANLLSVPKYLAVLGLLLGVTALYPELKIVQRVASARRLLSTVLVVLISATSFTFFSQYPVATFADDVHQRLIWSYRFDVSRELGYVAQEAAARNLNDSLASLTHQEKEDLRLAFGEIEKREAPYLVARYLARQAAGGEAPRHRLLGSLDVSADPNRVTIPPEVERVPATLSEQKEVDRLVQEKNTSLFEANARSDEILLALKEGVAALLGLPFQRFEPILGAYFEEVVGVEARRLIDRAIEINRQSAGKIPQPEDLLSRSEERRNLARRARGLLTFLVKQGPPTQGQIRQSAAVQRAEIRERVRKAEEQVKIEAIETKAPGRRPVPFRPKPPVRRPVR